MGVSTPQCKELFDFCFSALKHSLDGSLMTVFTIQRPVFSAGFEYFSISVSVCSLNYAVMGICIITTSVADANSSSVHQGFAHRRDNGTEQKHIES